MKRIISVIILFIPSFVTILAQGLGRPNPSAAYCIKMGYEYINEKDAEGNENGYCILPDKSKVDAWAFFRGEVKSEFSYCARMGFKLESRVIKKNDFEYRCAYCINDRAGLKNTSEDSGKYIDFREIPMIELMEKNGEPLIEKVKPTGKKDPPLRNNEMPDMTTPVKKTGNSGLKSTASLPASFDWRNVDDYNYVNPIFNQHLINCGCCYACAAVACAEGAYNKFYNLYNSDRIMFSRAFIYRCLSSLGKYSFWGCAGADQNQYDELEALTNEGIIEYKNYPDTPVTYCNHWDFPRVAFSGWQTVPCNDINAIKTAIIDYGVVYAGMFSEEYEFDHYEEGIYYSDFYNTSWSDCCNISHTDHAVSLVGWGTYDVDKTYWILRNSWGYEWGMGGYAFIDAESSLISSKVAYFNTDPITHKFFGYNMVKSDIIKSGDHIEYIGQNSVTLNPGFEVQVGAEFTAKVGPSH
ncbi:MAG: DUF333 domain-containing protein [Bacteroidales bacterium]|nr:DUF333 domain-containing protein [Bacteroidales bacterium]